MRIRLKTANGPYKPGDIVDVTYVVGANLCYYGAAEEVHGEPQDKAIEAAPKDKMIRKPRTRRKARPGGQPNGKRQNQNA